jgi:hypothetical protein
MNIDDIQYKPLVKERALPDAFSVQKDDRFYQQAFSELPAERPPRSFAENLLGQLELDYKFEK